MSSPDVVLEEGDRISAWANRLRDMAKRNGGKISVSKDDVVFYVDPDDNPQQVVESYNREREAPKKPQKERKSR